MVETGDYLILNIVAGKRGLVKCHAVSKSGDKLRVRNAQVGKGSEDDSVFEASAKEVVANLGPSPHVGSAYGLQVEPMRERIDHSFWGEIQIFHPLDDRQRKILRKEMKVAQEHLEKLRAPRIELTTQIKTQTGKMLGFYKYRPKADTDILCVKLDDDVSDMQYKLGHEFAHGVWSRCFLPKMKMSWVKMYHDALEIDIVSDDDLKGILEDLKTYGDLRGFCKENPDLAPTMRAVFRHIKQTHSLERHHFDMALMLGEDVGQYWPTSVELAEKQVIITEYARKSPEELWAEAYGLKFSGKKLPSKVDALLEKCMTRLVK